MRAGDGAESGGVEPRSGSCGRHLVDNNAFVAEVVPLPGVEGAESSGVEGAEGADADAVRYTIDELAAASGVPSRTIRFYQSKGTLPAPERRGRVAYYGEVHRERLAQIGELQDRGLRLDAIRDVLERASQGGDALFQWLGIGDRLQAPWTDDRPIVLTEDELLERVGDRRPGILAELSRTGLVERQGHSRPATYVVPSPGLLDIAARLDAAGVDPVTAWEAAGVIRGRMARATDDLVKFFVERTGEGFTDGGNPEQIVQAFDALRPLAAQAVQLLFAQEMERSLGAFVASGGAVRGTRRR